ncbi:hypothetical protein DKP78_17695, partial [Enterococcus faecium]
QDHNVVTTVIHFVVIMLAPRMFAEHQGNIIVCRCLKGAAPAPSLPEPKLLIPSTLEGGNCYRSFFLLHFHRKQISAGCGGSSMTNDGALLARASQDG